MQGSSELALAQAIFLPSDKQHLDIVLRSDDSRPDLHYHGFWPDPTLRARMAESLVKVIDYSPTTANLRARLERTDSGFRLALLLVYSDGFMFVSEHAPTPRKALQRSLDGIYLKIRKWRRERFIEQNGEEFLQSVARKVAHTTVRESELNYKVLIIDDNPVSTKLIETCLKQQGCATIRATSGREAVQKVTNQDYDLVILDWQMPEMTGGEVLVSAQDIISYDSTFRLPWVTTHLPVVTYSAEEQEQIAIPSCENFDIVGHIPKTASYPELKRVTSDILGLLRPL